MSITDVLEAAEIEDQASRSQAWQNYWRLLQRAESGDPLDSAARAELLASAKLLNRTARIQTDAAIIRKALVARSELKRIESTDLAAEKIAIDEQAEVLRAELSAFIAQHQPRALALQQRQEKWELDRASRGSHAGTIENFERLISAGPDDEGSSRFSV